MSGRMKEGDDIKQGSSDEEVIGRSTATLFTALLFVSSLHGFTPIYLLSEQTLLDYLLLQQHKSYKTPS
jgi:hypothetical protein